MDSDTESIDSFSFGEDFLDMEELLRKYMRNWLDTEGKKILVEYSVLYFKTENKKLEEEKLKLQKEVEEKEKLKSIPLIEIPDIGSPKKEKSLSSRPVLKKYKRVVTPSKFET